MRDEASIIRDAEGKPLHLQGCWSTSSRPASGGGATPTSVPGALYQAAETLQRPGHPHPGSRLPPTVDCFDCAWPGWAGPAGDGGAAPSAWRGSSLADMSATSPCTHRRGRTRSSAMRMGTWCRCPISPRTRPFTPWRPDALARGLCALVVLPLCARRTCWGARGVRPPSSQFGSRRSTMEPWPTSPRGLERAQLTGRCSAGTLEQVRLRTGERASEARFRVLEHSASASLTDRGRI